MQFGTGISGSVLGGLYGGNGSAAGGAGSPAVSSGPTGSPSLAAKAFGVQQDGSSNSGVAASWIAAAAFIGLIAIWWSLPK